MTNKFEERINLLRAASDADEALAWFKENGDVPQAAISFTVSVNGYATSPGQKAQKYLLQAARNLTKTIAGHAEALAKEDVRRGEEVL
jgi:hypothetical protein